MNRRTPATALLVAVVLVAIALLAPVSLAGANRLASHSGRTAGPPVVVVDDAGFPTVPVEGAPIPNPGPGPIIVDPQSLALHDDMRHLWVDHVVWSRVITMSVFSDLKGLDAYKDRLVTNAYDMTNLLVPYYGKQYASTFAQLFEQHVAIASDVFDAYKTGNQTLIRDATYVWYQNADDIASFLCKINPAWDYAEMRTMWRQHLDTVIDEALDYQKADYTGDVMCYDAAQDHVFALADFLSDGITAQFPPMKK